MTPQEIELIERYIDGTLAEQHLDELRTLLRESAEAREKLRSLATIDFGLQDITTRQVPDSIQQTLLDPTSPQNADSPDVLITATKNAVFLPKNSRSSFPFLTNMLLVTAATTIVVLGVSLFLQHANHQQSLAALSPNKNPHVAKIIGLGGSISWTGDGGQVTNKLRIGSKLTGGTIESSSPTSWVELEFLDKSTATVSGDSQLTFSDLGQKILHLKKGNVTSKVSPQEADRPMLVHTRTATLKVLGTEFNVESDLDATSLSVTEGKVRLKRLSDGKVVDVPANQRVVSATGEKLTPYVIPDSVSQWKSQLQTNPLGIHGRLIPRTETTDARLKAVPYVHTTPQGESFAMFAAGLKISGKDGAIVKLHPNSMIRVHGFVKEPHYCVLGVTVRQSNGDHGGNFMVIDPKLNPDSDDKFVYIIKASDLRLSPEVTKSRESKSLSPVNSIVEVFFCSTLNRSAGLEITEVEIYETDQP